MKNQWGIALLLVLSGCGQTPVAPTPVIVNQTVIVGGGGTTTPGDSTGGVGGVLSVTVNAFGAPIGSATGGCSRGQKQIAIGCQQAITCNPRDGDGEVIFNTKVTGTSPSSFDVVPGSDPDVAGVKLDDANGFNLYITGRKTGILSFICSVKGVSSPPTAFTVVN